MNHRSPETDTAMDNDPAQLDRLIAEFDTAMLVTSSLNGKPRARPMAIARHDAGARLYFATRSDDEKLEEVLRSPALCITLQDGERYLSLTGTARVETDAQLARELWSPSMNLWFPDGAEDPHLNLLVVTPEYAEYWDRTGLRRLEFLWEAGKALIRGEKADDRSLSGHAKIRPRQAGRALRTPARPAAGS
ncbi:pyridoxamine 5'-phosphate oxidase family protein [Elongatibacter sediminis]|uniref:Pyridoxamine 5'-phosphate oxidase family protein n=1 Tax=Elongatibacter sediminis TaxID=3119006 RepID=A0AAW9RDD2_9GAMM